MKWTAPLTNLSNKMHNIRDGWFWLITNFSGMTSIPQLSENDKKKVKLRKLTE